MAAIARFYATDTVAAVALDATNPNGPPIDVTKAVSWDRCRPERQQQMAGLDRGRNAMSRALFNGWRSLKPRREPSSAKCGSSNPGEKAAQRQAEMIAAGKAHPDDHFVAVTWVQPRGRLADTVYKGAASIDLATSPGKGPARGLRVVAVEDDHGDADALVLFAE
jgi:hypothetical protein